MLNQIVVVCFSGLIGGIVGAFLSYQFNKRLEGIRREQIIKDKATAIAKLFTKLLHRRGADPRELAMDCTKISVELALYLPSDLYEVITHKVLYGNNITDKDWRETLLLIKNHLHGTNEKKPIRPVFWMPEHFIDEFKKTSKS